MPEPTVCAVMLTADRPELARRAVECFRRQAYPAKRLLVYDTGAEDVEMDWLGDEDDSRHQDIEVLESAGVDHHGERKTIGYLRNRANAAAAERDARILIHWDDDDWSHPNRMAEQVELLQSSGADAVGYNELLFCYSSEIGRLDLQRTGEAWIYTGSILGTSLCYWRKTWERVPFRSQRANPMHDKGVGEDHDFLLDLHAAGMKSVGVSGFGHDEPTVKLSCQGTDFGPRMIARIHGSNTSNAYNPADMARETQHWKRVPEWDQFCRRTMEWKRDGIGC